MKRFVWTGVVCLLVSFTLPAAMAQDETIKQQVRDFPPDLTETYRPAIPADFAPGGQIAFLPSSGITVVDVVVSNTSKTLKNTNHSSNSEPSIAINPTNPKQIDILAFTSGWGPTAPVWHSNNSGLIWSLDNSIPNPTGLAQVGCPCDQTPDYGEQGDLSATFLDANSNFSLINAYTASTDNAASKSSWQWFTFGGMAQPTDQQGQGATDQPWLLVNRDPVTSSQDNVYVAYDNFNGAPDMRVAVAPGSDPPDFTVDSLAGFSQGAINPGQRLAKDINTGAIYTLFQQCPTTVPNCNNLTADPKTIHWLLNRSTDGGKTWSLNGSSTGVVVATGQSSQPQPKFGTVNALLGGVNHVTVDPNNSDVYVVYGNRDAKTTKHRLSIVRLTSDGHGGLKKSASHFVTGQIDAALPSVAVAKNSTGTVGVLYTEFTGFDQSSGLPMFTAWLALSNDHGVTFTQNKLESFLSTAKDDGNGRQRILGDYQQIKALGNTFYGVFTGNGVPFGRPFANMDPIFFTTTVAP